MMKECIQITLMEIPFQNMLNLRPIHKLSIIWCQEQDEEGDLEANKDLVFKKLKKQCHFEIAHTEDQAISVIKNSVRAILVIVPKFGSSFLPNYFGALQHPQNVASAIMYCRDV